MKVEDKLNKETVEEAAESKYIPGVYIINGIDICEASRECFIAGAKWQQERMYSEEDLRNAYRHGVQANYGTEKHFNQWFEKFKKK